MLLLAVANGGIRDFSYGRYLDELTANQLSTLSGCVLLGMVMWRFDKHYPPASGGEALLTGLFWMALTVAFEFLFFHYVTGHPWAELLANYNVRAGRTWVFVLVWVALAPYTFFRIRCSKRRRQAVHHGN